MVCLHMFVNDVTKIKKGKDLTKLSPQPSHTVELGQQQQPLCKIKLKSCAMIARIAVSLNLFKQTFQLMFNSNICQR